MLRRAGLILRDKPPSPIFACPRLLSHCAPCCRPLGHGLRQKLRHSTKMYQQQQQQQSVELTADPPRQERQQVVIPGLTFLAASQAQSQAEAQAQAQARMTSQRKQKGVVTETTNNMETVTSIPPKSSSSANPTQRQYQTPAQKKKRKNHAAITAAYAAVTVPKTTPREPTLPRDARTQPSAASGGIPDPSPSYLALSSHPSTQLPASRRILIIMDLNGTLLHRPSKKHPFHFVERPHAKRFMQYCLDNFYVAIWSSARPRNVHNMVTQLLTPAQMDRCLVTWARDKFGLTLADYDSRVQCYKRLTTVWDDPVIQAAHPNAAVGGRWDQTNTVLVDDSVEKGRSEPHNILVLPEFAGVNFEKVDVLPQVHDYLNKLCFQANISSYMRETPFQLDAAYALRQST